MVEPPLGRVPHLNPGLPLPGHVHVFTLYHQLGDEGPATKHTESVSYDNDCLTYSVLPDSSPLTNSKGVLETYSPPMIDGLLTMRLATFHLIKLCFLFLV